MCFHLLLLSSEWSRRKQWAANLRIKSWLRLAKLALVPPETTQRSSPASRPFSCSSRPPSSELPPEQLCLQLPSQISLGPACSPAECGIRRSWLGACPIQRRAPPAYPCSSKLL